MVISNILSHLIELTSNVTNAYTTALFTADKVNKTLVLREHLSLGRNLNEDVSIPFGQGPVGQAAQTRRPVITEYFEENASRLKIYQKDENLKCFLALPVIFKELEGVLLVDSKESYSFTTKQQKILAGFAEQMAWHLYQERSVNNVKEESDPFLMEINSYCRFIAQSLNRAAVAARLIQIPPDIIQYDVIAVVWFDSAEHPGKIANHRGFSFPLSASPVIPGKGIVGSCAKGGVPILIRHTGGRKTVLFHEGETPEELGSLAAVPVALGDQLQGVLLCGSRDPHAYSQTDIDRLSLIASSASSALLCADTKRRWDYDKNLDQITGIPNHRFLMEHRQAVGEEVFKSGEPVFLFTLRLTNLPFIYESFGLACGDQLLRQIVSLLSRVVPSPKYVFKYSDTAFLVILMGRERQEIYSLEDKLKKVIEKNPFYINGKTLHLEADWGRAWYPEDGRNLVDLIGVSWARTSQKMKVTP
ncbi:MAG: GAF domain-containing protein [Nitrospinaceae bacterium]